MGVIRLPDGFARPDFALRVALGLVPGATSLNKFGRNPDIDTGTDPEDVWPQGGLWVGPTAARIHNIVSTSDEDGAGTFTGLNDVLVEGLGADLSMQSEVVALDGLTPVPTVNAYWRIFRMYPTTAAGTARTNVGDITATAVTDGTITACIKAGDGQTLMAIYTVPAGHTFVMTQMYNSINKAASTVAVDYALRSSGPIDTPNMPWRIRHFEGSQSTGSSHVGHSLHPPKVFSEKTDLVMRVDLVSASDADISGGFDGYVMDNATWGLP